jgi:hypothetical protein
VSAADAGGALQWGRMGWDVMGSQGKGIEKKCIFVNLCKYQLKD